MNNIQHDVNRREVTEHIDNINLKHIINYPIVAIMKEMCYNISFLKSK